MADPDTIGTARQSPASGKSLRRSMHKGTGWWIIVAVFACMGLLPFVIAAIVLLGRQALGP